MNGKWLDGFSHSRSHWHMKKYENLVRCSPVPLQIFICCLKWSLCGFHHNRSYYLQLNHTIISFTSNVSHAPLLVSVVRWDNPDALQSRHKGTRMHSSAWTSVCTRTKWSVNAVTPTKFNYSGFRYIIWFPNNVVNFSCISAHTLMHDHSDAHAHKRMISGTDLNLLHHKPLFHSLLLLMVNLICGGFMWLYGSSSKRLIQLFYLSSFPSFINEITVGITFHERGCGQQRAIKWWKLNEGGTIRTRDLFI